MTEECDSLKILRDLWGEYNSLPIGIERDYVSEDIFNILAAMLKVVLKNRVEYVETNINDKVGRKYN